MLSWVRNREKHSQLSRVEVSFLLLLLVFGVPMILLIPPGAGYDEEDHLVRVWELSRFSLIPGQLSPQEMNYPIVFRDFAYRQQGSSGVIDEEFWRKYGRASLYEDGVVHREIDTKSVYAPALLLPQAMVLRLFLGSTNASALLVFYGCRLASLLSYLVLTWVAIRLLPFGKWILLVLALAPMSLFQAATISPDAISNGIGFLFIAGSLSIAGVNGIGWKEVASLLFLAFLLFLAKLNLIPLIVLPFLMMPPAKFTQKRAYVFLLAMTLVLFVVEVAGWNLIAAARSNPLMANEANPAAQFLYVLSYPLSSLFTVIKDLLTNGWMYFQGWINGYGYYYWTPPLVISLFFLLGLVAALLSDSTREPLSRKNRVALVIVFLAGYLATVASVYLTFTPVGAAQVLGMQGRYFVPLALLLFLATPGILWTGKESARRWVIFFITVALALNLLGIFLSFHIPCGATFYRTDLCYRPLSRDFTDTRLSPPVSDEISLTQEIQVQCDGLTEIRVLPSPSIAEDTGTTHFILEDRSGNQPRFETSLANNDISAEDWYPLRFELDWQSAGKQYVLTILGQNTAAGHGIRFLYTTQPEFDLGNLTENGQSMDEDIVLQYGCATGLRKLWLTGKP